MLRNVSFLRNLLDKIKLVGNSILMEPVSVVSQPIEIVKPDDEPVRKRRRKEYTYALLLSYQGNKYNGMQVQKDFPTIEGELFKAMAECGYIPRTDVLAPVRFGFQRAARTDRSVSAARQMCSMRLSPENHENFLKTATDQLNKYLPAEIRVLGIRRAIRSFTAHKDCDKRTYSYTLPTYAFAKADELTTNDFRINEVSIAELNGLCAMYKGTHNFFNYTSGKVYEDRSNMRYIHDFKCGPTQLVEDGVRGDVVEFVTLYITGQSFMLHQIRKMIGMTIATVRGFCGSGDIEKTFNNERMDVPKAPGLGLILEKVHYERYDKWYEKTHEKLNNWGEEIEAKADEFRQRYIIQEICRQELASHSMFLWLTTLLRHDITTCGTRDSRERSPLGKASDLAHRINDQTTRKEANEEKHIPVYDAAEKDIERNKQEGRNTNSKMGNYTVHCGTDCANESLGNCNAEESSGTS